MNHSSKFCALVSVVAVTAGCAGTPRAHSGPDALSPAGAATLARPDANAGGGLSTAAALGKDVIRLEDVLRYASQNRQEIIAARARARAAAERPAIVAALEDPMVTPSIDHAPYMMWGEQADLSFMIEQQFPFSHIRRHRRDAARAEARRLDLDTERVTQNVMLEAARAFLMLRERRETARVIGEQIALAREFVAAANARYGAATGGQADVLRAEIEVARLEAEVRTVRVQIAAAEAMFNTSLGRAAEMPVLRVEGVVPTEEPRSWDALREAALRQRAELSAGRAEISRAESEILVMKSMYKPMGVLRTGPAYTMADKGGWMLGIGVSLPIWRSRLNAGVREAQAMAEMARADVAAMTRMIEGEAAAARNEVLAARERVLALQQDVLPRARRAIDPSLAAYAAGTLPLTSVVDAAQALWGLQAELVAAEFELGMAWARLHRAQGRFETGGGP